MLFLGECIADGHILWSGYGKSDPIGAGIIIVIGRNHVAGCSCTDSHRIHEIVAQRVSCQNALYSFQKTVCALNLLNRHILKETGTVVGKLNIIGIFLIQCIIRFLRSQPVKLTFRIFYLLARNRVDHTVIKLLKKTFLHLLLPDTKYLIDHSFCLFLPVLSVNLRIFYILTVVIFLLCREKQIAVQKILSGRDFRKILIQHKIGLIELLKKTVRLQNILIILCRLPVKHGIECHENNCGKDNQRPCNHQTEFFTVFRFCIQRPTPPLNILVPGDLTQSFPGFS